MGSAANYRLVSEVYPSPWLRREDLKGRSVRVTIERVTVKSLHQVDGSEADKIVLSFRGTSKALACNKTQARTLAGLLGTEEFGEWTGAAIVLTPGQAPNGKATIVITAPASSNGQEEG